MTNSPNLKPQDVVHSTFIARLTQITVLSLGAAAFLNCIAAFFHLNLYSDAPYYFLRVVETNSFNLSEPASRTVQVLQQFPVLLLSGLGVSKIDDLLIVGGMSNLLLPLIFVASCYWVLPRHRKGFFLLPLFHYFGGSLASWMPTATEVPLAAAYFWVLFYWILFRPGRGWSAVLLVVLALAAVFLHQALSFLGPFLILAAIWRIHSTPDRSEKLFFAVAASWFVVVTYTAIHYTVFVHDPTNRQGFVTDLTELRWVDYDGPNIAVIASAIIGTLLLALLLANLLYISPRFKRCVRRILTFLGIALVIVLLAVLSFRYSEYGAYTQFAARAHAAFLSVPLAAVALISVAYPTVARAWQDRSAIILVSCLAAIVLGWHSLGLTLWADYVRDFRTVLLSGDGYIPFEEGLMKVPLEKRRLFQRLTWGWTNPTISYLLSPKQQVSTILGARATTVWQPFDPCKLDTLPHRKFNIRPYLSAIDAKGCVGVSRPGDSDPSPD